MWKYSKGLYKHTLIQRCRAMENDQKYGTEHSTGSLQDIFHPAKIFILLLLLFSTSCDLYPQDDYQEFYVVESYLTANSELPQVRLSRTLPVEEKYTFEKAAISEATVVIALLKEDGRAGQVYPYRLQSPGVFVPVIKEIVRPQRTYQLKVTFPDNDKAVTAKTIVPGSFNTVDFETDTVTYQDPQQITVTTTRSRYPGRQSFFIFTVKALEPSELNLTPFYSDLSEDSENGLSDFILNSSGIINELNYDQNPDGTLTLRVPWLAVAFYGSNEITANAIDDNMYDFVRSQEIQTGGGPSTLPPGEIQNVIYNVEGGIGIFGSMTSDTNRVFVRK